MSRRKRPLWTPKRKSEPEPEPVRIAILVPSTSMVPVSFAHDLAQLAGYSTSHLPAGVELHLIHNEGTYIHTMRQDLVENAVKADCDYMLFLDSDMRFPPDALLRLLDHRVDIVGINYSHRKVPCDFVALKERSPDNVTPATRLVTTAESTGLERVFSIGFGVTLLTTDLFVKIGPPPWFRNDYDESVRRFVGEDVYFCVRCQEAGVPVFVDHDLSKLCAHTGQFHFTTEHAEESRRQMALMQENTDGPDNGLRLAEVGGGDVAEQE